LLTLSAQAAADGLKVPVRHGLLLIISNNAKINFSIKCILVNKGVKIPGEIAKVTDQGGI